MTIRDDQPKPRSSRRVRHGIAITLVVFAGAILVFGIYVEIAEDNASSTRVGETLMPLILPLVSAAVILVALPRLRDVRIGFGELIEIFVAAKEGRTHDPEFGDEVAKKNKVKPRRGAKKG